MEDAFFLVFLIPPFIFEVPWGCSFPRGFFLGKPEVSHRKRGGDG
jgi:hypothetical protein